VRVAVAAVLVLLVTGCSAVSRASTVTSAATASAPRTSTPSPHALPLTTVSFSCRLPVLGLPNEGDFPGGFITFPAATLTWDPAGLITDDISSGLLRTAQAPVLTGQPSPGTGLPFYDAAAQRWLPVGPGETSPDGSQYAYAYPPAGGSTSSRVAQIHVVDVASAVDRTFSVAPPTPGGWIQVADFDGAGIYFTSSDQMSFYGLWRLDVATGHVMSVAQVSYVEVVRAGIVWAGLNDPRDPNPPGGGQSFDTLIAVDLATGARTTWAYEPGHIVSVLSVDASGRPTVAITDPPDYISGKVERLIAPGRADFISDDQHHWLVQADGDRLWLGSDLGMYLYTPAAGLQKVYTLADPRAVGIAPEGFCR
jgi:hypothetical protein